MMIHDSTHAGTVVIILRSFIATPLSALLGKLSVNLAELLLESAVCCVHKRD